MFSTTERPLSETQTYIFEKVQGLLIKHKKAQLGENLSSQQLEEINSTAELIAKMYTQQIEGLYQLDRNLRGYKELRSLVWSIPFNGVKTEEIDNLSKEISVFLSQDKSRDEIELDIRNAIKPYAERNPNFIKQQIEQIEQQIIEEKQRIVAAQQQVERERQEKLAAQQQAEKWKRKYEEMVAVLSSSSSSNSVSSSPASSLFLSQSSSSTDGSRVNTSELSKPLLLSNTTNERKRRASLDSKEEERKSPSLRPSGTNTSTSENG